MPAATSPSRIFTIPSEAPFLRTLARAILRGELTAGSNPATGPLALADITILLPTSRSVRALQDAIHAESGSRTVILPRIRPISQGDEELSLLSELASPSGLSSLDWEAPRPIDELERRLVLTQLVMAWSQSRRAGCRRGSAIDLFSAAGVETPAQAATLAAELARLMDMIETEGVSLDGIADLVPDRHSEHWQRTLEFLKIVTVFWPQHLAEQGLASPKAALNSAILTEARRLKDRPPATPYIVAGVTGSIPATAELMRAVAMLPQGAIVLPGLDLTLDEEGWAAIGESVSGTQRQHPEHPQFALKMLLHRLGARRQDVHMLGGFDGRDERVGRTVFVSEAMRPASTTSHWPTFAATCDREALRGSLAGINLIETPSAHDEAETVALILREALETPGQTAALVSPDRLLARRVAARLETWGIRVDDSAGRPFPKTVPGTFLELIVEAASKRFAPADLVALLKHPLTRLGLGAFEVRRAARALEIAALRTAYLGTGLDGVEAALEQAAAELAAGERRGAAVRRLWDEDWAGARELIKRMREAFAPLTSLFWAHETHELRALTTAHIAVAEAVARLPEEDIEEPGDAAAASELYAGEAGAAAAQLFAAFATANQPGLRVSAADYADFYRVLVARENVRSRIPMHPRLAIWGPFEARLQQPDIVVLGSLNDGKWPEAADPGPWLNRPMRAELGLPAPEEQIGHAAHDFTSLLGAARVYLTRAEKVDGVPTVRSRWLLRFMALLEGIGLQDALTADRPWLGWARMRDHIGERRRIDPPRPAPPVALRPRQISVSGVEQWLANPYAIFARHILRLEELPMLGEPPDNALKGSLIHGVLAEFARRHPQRLPADVAAELVAIAGQTLEPYLGHPRIAAFWLPRLKRFAQWFAETEPERRAASLGVMAEIPGAMVLSAPEGPFMLTARADRLDTTAAGLVITDYKTGQLPTEKSVLQGASPQLPLEAAIALEGGFAHQPAQAVIGLSYIRSSGGMPAGEERQLKVENIQELAMQHLKGLERLVAEFDRPSTPYAAVRRPAFAATYTFDAFAHLARVDEWAQRPETENTE